ncbi:MAG TPA: hypothetical protein VK401_07535 [Propionibacteriaceae bacterium]|jgi:hypothetical protein|nr:hypothetical protein [Propionibacteriaceae bacterium]
MSQNEIGVALLLCVATVAAYWRQIAVFMTLVVGMIFCAGVYHIVSVLHL